MIKELVSITIRKGAPSLGKGGTNAKYDYSAVYEYKVPGENVHQYHTEEFDQNQEGNILKQAQMKVDKLE